MLASASGKKPAVGPSKKAPGMVTSMPTVTMRLMGNRVSLSCPSSGWETRLMSELQVMIRPISLVL